MRRGINGLAGLQGLKPGNSQRARRLGAQQEFLDAIAERESQCRQGWEVQWSERWRGGARLLAPAFSATWPGLRAKAARAALRSGGRAAWARRGWIGSARMEVVFAAFLLAVPAGWGAPKDGTHRSALSSLSPGEQRVLNPLHPGEESLRLLQDYLRDAGHVDQDVAAMTREQALLLLFALHDYDKSGQLDGLEFMHLLSELSSPQLEGKSVPDLVVRTVDAILETQDWNRDGLLTPSELLLHPQEAQPPPLLDGPSDEGGTEQQVIPELAGMDSDLTGTLSQKGPAEPPKTFEATKDHKRTEGASQFPPMQKVEATDAAEVPGDAQQEETTMEELSNKD